VQAIELHGGRAIRYSTGEFVDDYAVDPEERNDLSFFFEVLARHAGVDSVRLHPVRIEGLRVHRASSDDARWLRRRIEILSRSHGTCVGEEDGVVVLTPE
jgi:poly-gamma-glutamate synthesis protein (capsule biosynthesis protein)